MNPVENFIAANPDEMLPIDQADVEDIQACAQYVKEIYTYLLQSEETYNIDPEFLSRQENFNADDRTLLYDWVSRAHSKFNLANESFFHFIAIFDKILEKTKLFSYDSRLTAMACLLIASKFEQSYIPSLRHYIEILMQEQSLRFVNCEQCLYKYQNQTGSKQFRRFAAIPSQDYETQPDTPAEILNIQNQLPPCQQCMRAALIQAEEEILHVLDFHLSMPTSLIFLRRFAKISNMKPRDRYIAFYLGELCAMNDSMVTTYRPSLIAAGCVAMTRRLTRRPSWSDELFQYSGYTEANIREVLQDVSSVLKQLALSPKVKYIRRKYAQQDRFYGVSVMIENVVGQVVGAQ
ncbi:G2/mitotic-specific_cyclin B [Hexamita inflata]|uniref:G2/mitotic-specific_cyclin B n=1 Tax=Hexamita inflata TaxID=28002 RepID=A0ABP1I7E0_9EUKA